MFPERDTLVKEEHRKHMMLEAEKERLISRASGKVRSKKRNPKQSVTRQPGSLGLSGLLLQFRKLLSS